MLTRDITYTDYDGMERTETVYFFLSESELAEEELRTPGGYRRLLERIVAEKDRQKLADMFKYILLKAYGEKSDDGRYFVKKRNGQALSELFEASPMFNVMYIEFLSDDGKSFAQFVNDILPESTKKGIPAPQK